MQKPLFLDRPFDHIGARRTGRSPVLEAYAGSCYKRPTSWWDYAARVAAALLVLGAIGMLAGAR